MAPKVKIEDILPSGEKISVVIEGPEISERRVLQVLELLRLMSGGAEKRREAKKTLKERLWQVIEENFGSGEWFTIRDLYAAVRAAHRDVPETTLSSYLTRFLREGRLEKRGRKPSTEYRVKLARARAF